MPRPKGSKNKPKNIVSKQTSPKREGSSFKFVLEEDTTKLRHSLDRIPMLSDDGYRIKETIGVLKTFGYSSKQIKQFLIDGTIPLK